MRAIVLLNVISGNETAVIEKVREIPEIIDSFITFGEYDVSILLQAASAKQLAHIVTGKIRKIDGVMKTLTLIEAVNGTENN